MSHRFLNGVVVIGPVLFATVIAGQSMREIPKTWDDAAIESLEVPLSRPNTPPFTSAAVSTTPFPSGPSTKAIRPMHRVKHRPATSTG